MISVAFGIYFLMLWAFFLAKHRVSGTLCYSFVGYVSLADFAFIRFVVFGLLSSQSWFCDY